MNVLITTIYKGSAVIQAIKSFSPDKIYFLADDSPDEVRKNSINMIKELFPHINYQTLSAKLYDIVTIAKVVMEAINNEKGNKIIIHISEGRKTMSFGLLFGSYAKKDLIDSIYYITEETNTPIQLPLVDLKLSKQKVQLLQKINEGCNSIPELEIALDVKSPTVYVHMKELRDDGFLDKSNRITEIGRIILLKE